MKSFVLIVLLSAPFGYGQDEFVGPFSSWINAKTQHGAAGDGVTDDTAAIQSCINALSITHPICYLPAGTYKITSHPDTSTCSETPNSSCTYNVSLIMKAASNQGLIGHDPADTILKYAGTSGGWMFWGNDIAHTRFERITWDGSNLAGIGWAMKWDSKHVKPGFPSFFTFHQDEIFKNMAKGMVMGDATFGGNADAQGSIYRVHFSIISTAAVSVEAYNAYQFDFWDCDFNTVTRGLTNALGANGNFHVYRSTFENNSVADVLVGNSFDFALVDNWSSGSNQFFSQPYRSGGGSHLLIKGNTILNTAQPNTIYFGSCGPALVVDNTILTKRGNTGPVINTSGQACETVISVGNKYTVSSTIGIGSGRSKSLDDSVVSPGSIDTMPPPLPGFNPNNNRPVYEVPVGASAATIQTAINNAAAVGNRAVVHIPAGSYTIDSTLSVPATSPIQIIGDSWATLLTWSGAAGGKIIDLQSPSQTKLEEIAFNGNSGAADGIVAENADQVGSRVYAAQFDGLLATGYNVLLNGNANTVVNLEGANNQVNTAGAYGIVAVGGGGSGHIGVFAPTNLIGSGTSLYDVRSGGDVMVEGAYSEGAPRAQYAFGSSSDGTFTLANGNIGFETAGSGDAVSINGSTGNFLIEGIRIATNATFNISGANSSMNAMMLADKTGSTTTAGLDDTAAAGTHGYYFPFLTSSTGASVPSTSTGTTTDTFLRTSLAHLRAVHSSRLSSPEPGVTDIRLFNVRVSSGAVNLCIRAGIFTDSTAPTAPSALSATVFSPTQINLSWTGSTDPDSSFSYYLQRCQGASCSNFAARATTPQGTTTYSDTGLSSGTTYQYRINAVDPSNNASAYSNTASATTTSTNNHGSHHPDLL